MKAYNTVYKILKAMSLIAMTLVLANCGKSDGGGGSAATGYVLSNGQCTNNGVVTALSSCQSVTTAGYGWVGSTCYQVGGGIYQQTQTNYCNGLASYQLYNGVCYQMSNGVQQAQVDASYCSVNNSGTGQTCTGYGNSYGSACTQLCNGQFYAAQYEGGYAVVPVACQEGSAPVSAYTQQNGVYYGDCSGLRLSTTMGSAYPNVTCQ